MAGQGLDEADFGLHFGFGGLSSYRRRGGVDQRRSNGVYRDVDHGGGGGGGDAGAAARARQAREADQRAANDANSDGGGGAAGSGGVEASGTLLGHEGDVYSVKHHPGMAHVATGGFDASVRLFDLRTCRLLKTFAEHDASVTSVAFNPHGNLIVSASKDCTLKFWDVLGGVCVRTLTLPGLSEITSVQMHSSGSMLLSSFKNNSNRVWDVRTGKLLPQLFKGHHNSSRNFVRSCFGPSQTLVVGGSEDSKVTPTPTPTPSGRPRQPPRLC
jgi:WD40 repeat protein